MKHLLHIFITVVCIAVVAGCADNSRLRDDIARAGRLADTRSDSAIALLDSLSPAIDQADKATRMRYDLMLVKSRDKAYIEHRNDSMIAPVVEYFADHTDPDLTPLALYYAGRVYSDLGDAPRALDYYQQALTTIGDDTIAHYNIYKVCLSQMSELFMYQRLYRYALESAEKAVDFSNELTLPIDYLTIGKSYSLLNVHDSTYLFYKKAYEVASTRGDSSLIYRVQHQFIEYYYKIGDFKKADSIISKLNMEYILQDKEQLYSIISKVKIANNNYNAALPYLKWLVDSGNIYGKCYANAELANYYSKQDDDYKTSVKYLNKYIELFDSSTNLFQIDAVTKIQGYYNYSIREKENNALLKKDSKKNLFIVILVGSILLIVSIFLFIVRDIQRKRLDLKCRNFTLQEIIESTRKNSQEHCSKLQAKIDELEEMLNKIEEVNSSAVIIKLKKSRTLLSEAMSNAEERAENHLKLMSSPIVIEFHDRLRTGKRILPSSPEWNELSQTVDEYNPGFIEKLVSVCRLSDREMQISLLLKIEFFPIEIAEFLGLSPSAISSIRKRLMKRIFSETENAPKNWDEFIRLL